mmetsp:Transcript_98601/g.274360  ORF Transcript_98601/g.274360 Transcript_98601/m.274360 type:complete len:152 (+) Transcript_98601:716-1171(+)
MKYAKHGMICSDTSCKSLAGRLRSHPGLLACARERRNGIWCVLAWQGLGKGLARAWQGCGLGSARGCGVCLLSAQGVRCVAWVWQEFGATFWHGLEKRQLFVNFSVELFQRRRAATHTLGSSLSWLRVPTSQDFSSLARRWSIPTLVRQSL